MREYEDVLLEVKNLLRPFLKSGQVVSEQTDLVADLGLDSLKVMELLTEVEDRLDVSVPLNILSDVRTVKDLAVQLKNILETG